MFQKLVKLTEYLSIPHFITKKYYRSYAEILLSFTLLLFLLHVLQFHKFQLSDLSFLRVLQFYQMYSKSLGLLCVVKFHKF